MLPLDDRHASSCSAPASATARPTRPTAATPTARRCRRCRRRSAPPLGGRSWDLDADIDRPPAPAACLYATGTENSGLSLFVQDDRLVFDYNASATHHVVVSDRAVPVGRRLVGVRFGRTGRARRRRPVVIDGRRRRCDLPCVMTIISSVGPSVGFDHGSAVSPRYTAPFRFTGVLRRLDVTAAPRAEGGDGAGPGCSRRAMARQ